jgi:diaminohydroxyphosphoribosylaminopyrimidine deaminase/5-amino-6-(5-phosphoribosylamino)uracil reductase
MFERSPVRVVLDARLRVPLSLSVVSTVRDTSTWIFASQKASPIAEEILQQKGGKVFRVDDTGGRLDLEEVLKVLAAQGITRLMVEGGPTVAAAFAAADLVDQAVIVRSDKAIGEGIAPLEGMTLDALTGQMQAIGREPAGGDVFETYGRR